MDANNLLNDLEIFASNGIVFSREQRVTLQNSLTVTKAQYNFSRIKFWGKITGLKDDYFVAQGYRKTNFSGNDKNSSSNNNLIQTLYSLNGGDWCILEDVDENVKNLALTVRGRFIGDPSFAYDCIDHNNDVTENNHKIADSNNNSSENKNNNHSNFGQGDSQELRILEETRLSAVVSIITKKALVCPKDSITSDGRLNSQWNGLDGNQATDLSNWCDGENNDLISREKGGEQESLKWSIQKQRGQGVDCVHVILKNLEWLGAIAFHTTETNQFGNIYVGNGEFNIDHPFMI